jgi:hypothetical protein
MIFLLVNFRLKVILKIKKLENEVILDFLISRSKERIVKIIRFLYLGFHFVAQNIEEWLNICTLY